MSTTADMGSASSPALCFQDQLSYNAQVTGKASSVQPPDINTPHGAAYNRDITWPLEVINHCFCRTIDPVLTLVEETQAWTQIHALSIVMSVFILSQPWCDIMLHSGDLYII